jgi:hypothetical protein
VTTVSKIRLTDLNFTDCPLVIADFQVFDIWGLRDTPALLIGMNFLRQFSKISIDYGLKELRFDLTQAIEPATPIWAGPPSLTPDSHPAIRSGDG